MNEQERAAHWDALYEVKRDAELSWFEPEPRLSLELIEAAGVPAHAAAIDVGGGRSRLCEALLERGHPFPTVLDVSATALAGLRARLGARAAQVRFVRSDVTTFAPAARFGLWHDRAVLHFLREPAEQRAYAGVLARALAPGGIALIGSFAKDGPQRCSGLPCARHDAASLAALVGAEFELIDARVHTHHTPWGLAQRFQFCVFRRSGA
jgi:SAM-dependent methyltransferase